MGRRSVHQTSFNTGVISRRALGRTDTKQYANGAEVLDNCMLHPQGGVYERSGIEWLTRLPRKLDTVALGTVTAPGGGTAANATDGDRTTLVTTGAVGTTNPFVILHCDLGALDDIEFIDVTDLKTSGSIDSDDEVKVQWSTDNAVWNDYDDVFPIVSTTARTKRLTETVNARYLRLVRVGATDLGSQTFSISGFAAWEEGSTISKPYTKEFDFNGEQQYTVVLTEGQATVYKDGVELVRCPIPHTEAQLAETTVLQSADTFLIFHDSIQTHKIVRETSESDWYQGLVVYTVPKFAFNVSIVNPAATLTPSAISGNINLTASAGVFLASDVGGYVTGNGGEARITAYTSATVVVAKVLVNFVNTTAIGSGSWELERGYEDAWSNTRGWPQCGTFHQNRLCVGGSASIPNGVWGSRGNDYFNFDFGSGFDDDAWESPLGTNQVNEVRHLVSTDRLEVFCNDSEHYIPGQPITPENALGSRQDTRGTNFVQPIFVDGATMFVQVNTNIVREFVWNELEAKYNARNLMVVSNDVVNSPQGLAWKRPYGDVDADMVFVANSDGTFAILNTMRQQEIVGWTTGTAAIGEVVDVSYSTPYLYAAVKATIDGQEDYHLCRFNEDFRLDMALSITKGGASTAWTGLEHLEGETVRVIVDGLIDPGEYVVTGGEITSQISGTVGQIGLFWTPRVKILPPNSETQDGPNRFKKRRIFRAHLQLEESMGVLVNGRPLPFLNFGDANIFDGPTPLFSGTKEIGLRGWSRDPYLEITQDDPHPFHLLSIMLGIKD